MYHSFFGVIFNDLDCRELPPLEGGQKSNLEHVWPNHSYVMHFLCLISHSFQVIASSLVNFIMLGVVFARFSAPFKRASTVRWAGGSNLNSLFV
jgi:hypothetical protein